MFELELSGSLPHNVLNVLVDFLHTRKIIRSTPYVTQSMTYLSNVDILSLSECVDLAPLGCLLSLLMSGAFAALASSDFTLCH